MTNNSTLGSYASYLRAGPESEGFDDGDVRYTITLDGVQQEDVNPDAGYSVALTVNGTGDHLALDGFNGYTARSLAQTYIKRWETARITIDGEPYEWEPPVDTPTADNAGMDTPTAGEHSSPSMKWQEGIRELSDALHDHGIEIETSDMAILAAIFAYMNRKTGIAWPGNGNIARFARLEKSYVAKRVRHLARRGIVVIVSPGRRDGTHARLKIGPPKGWK